MYKLIEYVKFALKDKPKFNKLLMPLQTQIDDILKELNKLLYIFSIEKANGAGLDLIGIFIKQPRITADYTNNGFIFDSSEQGFDQGDLDAGGELLSDDQYKLLLNASIILNNAKGWCRDEIIEYHKAMIPNGDFDISEDMAVVTVKYTNTLSDFNYQLLNNAPVHIAGIKVNYEIPV